MRLKTLLLGSAAAFAFAGGNAQAADLSVAEPVDYVRVCDAFGTGYWYIPGTDTCLKISGYVRFEVKYDDAGYVTDDHVEDYKFSTKVSVEFDARSQTDWGPLVAHITTETTLDPGSNDLEVVDDSYLSLGPLTAGFMKSAFSSGGGYTSIFGLDDGFISGLPNPPYSAATSDALNQIQLSWAMGGFGLILAVEDQRVRAGSWFGEPNSSVAGDIPDLVAALTAEGSGWNGKVAFLYADTNPDSTWGVMGRAEFDVFGSDNFAIEATYVDEQGGFGGADRQVLTVLASYLHYWQSNLWSAVTVRYDTWDCTSPACVAPTSDDDWAVAFETAYSPVENFTARVGVVYYDMADNLKATFRMQRDFGD